MTHSEPFINLVTFWIRNRYLLHYLFCLETIHLDKLRILLLCGDTLNYRFSKRPLVENTSCLLLVRLSNPSEVRCHVHVVRLLILLPFYPWLLRVWCHNSWLFFTLERTFLNSNKISLQNDSWQCTPDLAPSSESPSETVWRGRVTKSSVT